MTYTREYLQALSDKGYKTIPSSAFTIDEVLDLYARIDELESKLTDANAGAKLMHSPATGGESRLDADLAAMLQWEDEKPTREPYTDRKVTVPQILRSYASYKNTGKGQPLSAEEVDGERLGE